jgi:uncharacterized protein
MSNINEVNKVEYIDVNCMIGEWCFKDLKFKSPDGLIGEMDRLGINKALVYHSLSWMCDPKTGNDEVIVNISHYDRLIPVMVLNSMIDYEFGGRVQVTDYIRKNKIKAVRLFPFDNNYTLNMWNVEKLFSLLNELRIPVLIEYKSMHGSLEPYYSQLYELCRAFEDIPFIILNPGYRSLRIFYELFERCANFHIDSSSLIVFRGIEDIVKHFGSKRILYGSRMPFMEGGVSLGRLIYADIDEADRVNIAGRNITALMENIRG